MSLELVNPAFQVGNSPYPHGWNLFHLICGFLRTRLERMRFSVIDPHDAELTTG